MLASVFFKQPSLRRLLFFCLGLLFAYLTVSFVMWCPMQCWRIRRLLAGSQIDEALELAKSVARNHPQCAECQYLNAKAARRKGDFLDAKQALERATGLGWDSSDLARERILALVQTGRTAELQNELKTIFASELDATETDEVYEAVASGHLAAFDGPEFQQCLDYWLDWNPQAVKPRLMRAQFYEQLTNNFEASKQYESIVKDHPDCRAARLGWGSCLLQLNQPAAAEVQLRICLTEKREPKAAVLLARSLVQTGQSAAAGELLAEFKDVVEPAVRAKILEELGRWCLDQSQAAMAVTYLEESVAIAPEAASAWHSLAGAYAIQGNRDKFEHAMAISQQTQLRLQRLGVTVVEISKKPDDLSLRIEAAQILFEQGMDQDAVAWLNTVLRRDPRHSEVHAILARYYERHGNPKLARYHLQFGEPPEPVEPSQQTPAPSHRD